MPGVRLRSHGLDVRTLLRMGRESGVGEFATAEAR